MSRAKDATIAGVIAALALGVVLFALNRRNAVAPLAEKSEHPAAETTRERRREAWSVFAKLTREAPTATDLLSNWHRVEAVFGEDSRAQMAATHGGMTQSGEPQVIIFTLFNDLAAQHIRHHDLRNADELARLQTTGASDRTFSNNRTIPPFPEGSVAVLTAWWPIAPVGLTAMPVWDPELNPPLRGGNSYITWQRSLAVDPAADMGSSVPASIEFAGRKFPKASRISLKAFPRVEVDQALADQLSRSPLSRKAAVIALGRSLKPGDSLALVAVHIAAKQAGRWVWLTLWWHDQPDRGPYADGRPVELQGSWRHFLMDTPAEPDRLHASQSNVCFNPWLEARFPDDGGGGGTSSNCVTCHRRASFPAVGFLPLTHGVADVINDRAFAQGRLRTDMLWSVARRAGSFSPQ